MDAARERVRGYKTMIVAVVLLLLALAEFAGIDIPIGGEGGALVTGGAAMALLRVITTGPVFDTR